MAIDMLTLRRYGSIPGMGTYGRIHFGDTYVNTIEAPWNDNRPFVSCIPYGIYELVPFTSSKHGETYALQSADAGVWVSEVDMKKNLGQRFACILHSANVPGQLQGCIAAGNRFHWWASLKKHNPQLGIYGSSRQRTKELIDFIRDEKVKNLNITQAKCG